MSPSSLASTYSASAPPAPPKTSSPGLKRVTPAPTGFHDAGEVGPSARRVRRAHAFEEAQQVGLAGGHVPLEGIDAGGVHLDQDLRLRPVWAWRSVRRVRTLGCAITPLHDGAHGFGASRPAVAPVGRATHRLSVMASAAMPATNSAATPIRILYRSFMRSAAQSTVMTTLARARWLPMYSSASPASSSG